MTRLPAPDLWARGRRCVACWLLAAGCWLNPPHAPGCDHGVGACLPGHQALDVESTTLNWEGVATGWIDKVVCTGAARNGVCLCGGRE